MTKRVTLDEKRQRVQSIFYERPEVFTLKEIETIASREKGVVLATVKDVLQGLVDDNLVETDKIGSGNYFWALPSKAGQTRKVKIAKLEESIAALQTTIDENKKKKQALFKLRPPTELRLEKLQRLEELQEKKRKFHSELDNLAENDPEFLKKLNEGIKVAKEAANRWTDNIFSLQSHVQSNFGIEMEGFNRQFEIPANLDYVE